MPELRTGLRSGALGALLGARLRGGAFGPGLGAALRGGDRGALVSPLGAGGGGRDGCGGGRDVF